MAFSISRRTHKAINSSIGWLVGLSYLRPNKPTVGSRLVRLAPTPHGLLLSSGSRKVLLKGDWWQGALSKRLQIQMRDIFREMPDNFSVPIVSDGELYWQMASGNLSSAVPLAADLRNYYEVPEPGDIELPAEVVARLYSNLLTRPVDDTVWVELTNSVSVLVCAVSAVAFRQMIGKTLPVLEQTSVKFTVLEDGGVISFHASTPAFSLYLKARILDMEGEFPF